MKRCPKSRFRFTKASTAKPGWRLFTTVVSVAITFFFAKPLSGLDQNGDGLSDLWQQQYSVPSSDADLDYTGTGLTNRQKSLLGLDPRDPSARFHLDIFNDSANAQLRLQLNTVYGKRYQIESSIDLLSWSAFDSPIVGTGQIAEISLPLPQTATFFRAIYAGDVDFDADGLTAWEENLLGTNDNNPDTDSDGMPDLWEYSHGLNPLANDANTDSDGDGATNLQEYQAGTDPNDYYNGNLPTLTIYAGGDQRGNPGTILPVPISVVVNGNGRRNSPVTFRVAQGLALLAPDKSGNYPGVTSLTVRSTTRYPDAWGFYVAQVYVYLPATAGNISVIEAMVATGGATSAVKTTAVAIDPCLFPPTNLLVTATSPTTADISWTMASETTATMVQVTLDEGRTWINLGAAGPGVTRVTVTGLTPDYPVSFRVFSSSDYSGITNLFTIPRDPTSVPPPSNGAGGDATASATVRPLSEPIIEGEKKYFNLGAWGFSGFQNQNTYLTKTAVLTCDPENSVTYIDRIDPITGHQLPRETHTTGSAGCFGFYLGEPNTGEQIISNTEKLTESLPGDVDDFGRPVHKTLRLTLSDQNDEARLRQNAADKLPPFQGNFSEGIDDAYIYVDNSGYGVSALQYRWRVNADPNLVVKWDVQFTRVDASVQHSVQQWVTNNNTLSPTYLVDPRILNGGANGYYDVFLLMANLAVDGNRDGEMSFNDPAVRDPDRTTSDRPYRLWLNDDDDTELTPTGQPAESEMVPPAQPDYRWHQIISKRNLEDFARIWMDVGGAQGALSWGIQIGLKWKNVTGAPAINIYPSADGDGKNDYLSDENAAQAQISNPIFNEAVRDKNNKETVDTNSTFIFKSDYWTDLDFSDPRKCFLFEGASEGKGELTVVFLDPNGNEIAEGGSVWLDLKDIKKMYQRAIATPDPLTPLPYEIGSSTVDENTINYSPDVSPRFDQPTDEDSQCLVFVHGWRMSYDDSVSFTETMFKRLWWAGYNGRFVAFRWATQTSFNSYNTSEWMAWKYGKSLANYIENYVKHEVPGYTINIAAHSMGNVVTASALKRGMTINTYILMQAAIPSGCYNDSVNNYVRFLNAETMIPTPDTEAELGYRLFTESVTANVSKIVSFFNIDDYALATGTIPFLAWPFETNWEKNQVDYKPNHFGQQNSSWGDYLFSSGKPIGLQVSVNWNQDITGDYLSSRLVTDIHESMSFVARPRSKAVGAEIHSASVFGNVVNLQSVCNFGNGQEDHSGQFNRSIQQLNAFYQRVFQELQQ